MEGRCLTGTRGTCLFDFILSDSPCWGQNSRLYAPQAGVLPRAPPPAPHLGNSSPLFSRFRYLPKGLIPLASRKPRTCEVTEGGLGLPSSFLNPLKCRDDRLANTDQITHLFWGALETEHGALCVRGEYCNTEPPAPTNVAVPMWGAVLTRPGQTVSALTKHMLGWAIYTLLVCLSFCLFLIMCNCGYVHMSTRALEVESVGSPGLDS